MRKLLLFSTIILLALVACSESDVSVSVTGVTLNQNAATLTVGESKTKVATVLPDNATNRNISWTSSNPNIASVTSNGQITANSAGTATIIVTTADGGQTATSTITVNPLPMECEICGEFDCEIQHVKCPICDEYDCEKEHKECEVCGAWDCEIQHVKCPVCNEYDCEKEHTQCEVCGAWNCETQHDQCSICGAYNCEIEYVTSVTLNRNTTTLLVGETEILIVAILPENATNGNVSWRSSNPNIVIVDDNGAITGVSAGTATITVTTKCGTKMATCVVTVKNVNISSSLDGVVIDGIRWATRNVDERGTFTSSPEDVGVLYHWGTRYRWETAFATTLWTHAIDPCPEG